MSTNDTTPSEMKVREIVGEAVTDLRRDMHAVFTAKDRGLEDICRRLDNLESRERPTASTRSEALEDFKLVRRSEDGRRGYLEGFAAGLERAAKVCDEEVATWDRGLRGMELGNPQLTRFESARAEAESLARYIRSLQSSPTTQTGETLDEWPKQSHNPFGPGYVEPVALASSEPSAGGETALDHRIRWIAYDVIAQNGLIGDVNALRSRLDALESNKPTPSITAARVLDLQDEVAKMGGRIDALESRERPTASTRSEALEEAAREVLEWLDGCWLDGEDGQMRERLRSALDHKHTGEGGSSPSGSSAGDGEVLPERSDRPSPASSHALLARLVHALDNEVEGGATDDTPIMPRLMSEDLQAAIEDARTLLNAPPAIRSLQSSPTTQTGETTRAVRIDVRRFVHDLFEHGGSLDSELFDKWCDDVALALGAQGISTASKFAASPPQPIERETQENKAETGSTEGRAASSGMDGTQRTDEPRSPSEIPTSRDAGDRGPSAAGVEPGPVSAALVGEAGEGKCPECGHPTAAHDTWVHEPGNGFTFAWACEHTPDCRCTRTRTSLEGSAVEADPWDARKPPPITSYAPRPAVEAAEGATRGDVPLYTYVHDSEHCWLILRGAYNDLAGVNSEDGARRITDELNRRSTRHPAERDAEVVSAAKALLDEHVTLRGDCLHDEVNDHCEAHMMFWPCPVGALRSALSRTATETKDEETRRMK